MTKAWNGRPPAPLDERDGRHELHFWSGDYGGYSGCYEWRAETGQWFSIEEGGGLILEEFGFASVEYGAAVLTPEQIEAKIADAVKAEREACAAACDEERVEDTEDPTDVSYNVACGHCAAAIRARGDTP